MYYAVVVVSSRQLQVQAATAVYTHRKTFWAGIRKRAVPQPFKAKQSRTKLNKSNQIKINSTAAT